MPSYTPNHEFQLFADDETPWEHRTDFQKLDTRTPIVDTAANRVNWVAKTDALYFAYDTNTIYRGNGSSWVSMGELGSEGGGTDFGTATDPVASITNRHYRDVTTVASVSGNHTVDLTSSNVHVLTLTGNTTLSFTGEHPDLTSGTTLIIQQDATGGHSLTFAESIYWAGGAQPTLSTAANDRHKLVVENVAGDWEAAVVAENMGLVQYFEPVAIEDWEGGTLTGWTQTLGPSETWTVDTVAPVLEGSYSLKGSSLDSADMWVSTPGDGLPYYPQAGDIISAYLHDGDGVAQTQVQYGWYADKSNNCNAIMIDALNNTVEMRTWTAGSSGNVSTVSASISANTWYDVEVEIGTNDTFSGAVYAVDQSTGDRTDPANPIATISATDATHTANGGVMVGNRFAGAGSVAIDTVRKVGEL